MNIVFILDVRLIKRDNNYYTTGATDYEYFHKKLITKNDKLTVICRTVEDEFANNTNISNGEGIEIIGINKLRDIKKEKIREIIEESDFLILKMPTFNVISKYKEIVNYKKKYIVELVGCPWDAFWNHSIKGKIIAPYIWYKTRKIVKKSPYVVYVTNEFLQKRYPTTGKNIGVSDVELQEYNEDTLKNRVSNILCKNNSKIILGTLAAIDVEYKGQQYVIKAISKLKKKGYNFEYQLVGGGKKDRLERLAVKLGVIDNIKFLGSKPHKDIFSWLDNVDIYIQPSKTEGLPRALIEAMSKACPCIGSNAGGIPELLDKEYIFKKGKVKDLIKIFKTFDKEKMIEQANVNFEKAKKYEKKVLDKKRKKFYQNFLQGE